MNKEKEKKQPDPEEVGRNGLSWITNNPTTIQGMSAFPSPNLKVHLEDKKLVFARSLDFWLNEGWFKVADVKDGDKLTSDGLVFKGDSNIYEEFFILDKGMSKRALVPVVKKLRVPRN